MISTNAYDLEKLIKKTYGRAFDLPQWIEGGYLRTEVTKLYEDQKEDVENFKSGKSVPSVEKQNTLEALLADLCDKGKIKKGEHIIECID